MSTYTKMGRQGWGGSSFGGGGGAGFVREGFCPAPNTDITRSCPASQIFVPKFKVSPPTRPK